MHLTRPVAWLEARRRAACNAGLAWRAHIDCVRAEKHFCTQDHIDYLSIHALFFEREKLTLYKQVKLLFSYRTRISG
jgi:hypothetical protein